MVSEFLSRLVVALEADSGIWRLAAPLAYRSELVGFVEVPMGFETDFASVPRLPLVFWATGATAHRAAVVHDYLYKTAVVSRAVADRVFREASEASGVAGWRRWVMFWGVRVGGRSHYGAAAS